MGTVGNGEGEKPLSRRYFIPEATSPWKVSYLRTFIRIHLYTVPPTFQFTVWEDGFDYIVFFSNGNIKYDTTFNA